jgi:hypothetical protein
MKKTADQTIVPCAIDPGDGAQQGDGSAPAPILGQVAAISVPDFSLVATISLIYCLCWGGQMKKKLNMRKFFIPP